MANTYYHRGNYHNYNNRRYPKMQSIKPQQNKNIPMDLPPIKDVPPIQNNVSPQEILSNNNNQSTHRGVNGLLQNNPITSLLNIGTNTLDKDKLIILALMYLIYKEDKKNLKLILALGYILI